MLIKSGMITNYSYTDTERFMARHASSSHAALEGRYCLDHGLTETKATLFILFGRTTSRGFVRGE